MRKNVYFSGKKLPITVLKVRTIMSIPTEQYGRSFESREESFSAIKGESYISAFDLNFTGSDHFIVIAFSPKLF